MFKEFHNCRIKDKFLIGHQWYPRRVEDLQTSHKTSYLQITIIKAQWANGVVMTCLTKTATRAKSALTSTNTSVKSLIRWSLIGKFSKPWIWMKSSIAKIGITWGDVIQVMKKQLLDNIRVGNLNTAPRSGWLTIDNSHLAPLVCPRQISRSLSMIDRTNHHLGKWLHQVFKMKILICKIVSFINNKAKAHQVTWTLLKMFFHPRITSCHNKWL